ncbi:hypothetical protein QZH41_011517 [Actinostola sp. cb2023]|nr:hypothetical protein QZH41_011517 [Actinostola sp. cb2023]
MFAGNCTYPDPSDCQHTGSPTNDRFACMGYLWQAGSNEQVKSVHLIGAAMVLFCGIIYCWIQTIISYKMKLCGVNSACLFNTRATFTIAVSVFGVACVVFKGIAEKSWIKVAHNKTTGDWNPHDAGFVPHVIGNATEWLTAIMMLIFILTFLGEFKSIKMKLVVSRYNALPVPLSVSQESMRTPLLL